MAIEPSESRRSLPWVLFAISTAVAVLVTTGFVYLITKRTTGPVEVLRAFYQAVRDDDCEEAYSFMAESFQQGTSQDDWCRDTFPDLDVPDTFAVERVTLEGDTATVLLKEPDGTERAESLLRDGKTWRLGIPESPLRPPVTPEG